MLYVNWVKDDQHSVEALDFVETIINKQIPEEKRNS
jgi:hypothetical protein